MRESTSERAANGLGNGWAGDKSCVLVLVLYQAKGFGGYPKGWASDDHETGIVSRIREARILHTTKKNKGTKKSRMD